MISTIVYRSKKIVVWELDHTTYKVDLEKMMSTLEALPKNSALVLMDFSATKFNPELMTVMKELVSSEPHPSIRAIASAGVEGLKQIFIGSLDKAIKGNIKPEIFESVDEAKDWLITV